MQKTSFPIEILINDDASTDHTADIIREYESRYPDLIKPVYQKENQHSKGVIVLALVLSRAKGKYIAVCEGDDFWTDPKKLQIQYDFMESHPDYSLCFHGSRVLNMNTGTYDNSYFSHIINKDYTASELLERWTVPTASAFFRTEYRHDIPQNRDFWCGDIVTWLTMCESGKVHAFERKMSVYRLTPSGAISSLFSMEVNDRIERLRRHYIALRQEFPAVVSHRYYKAMMLSLDYDYLLNVKDKHGFDECRKEFFKFSLIKRFQIFSFYCRYRIRTAVHKIMGAG